LTPDNWFEIGLKHDHRQEFSELMDQMYILFPEINFFGSFNENGDVCLGSDDLEG
jgi:hypothetical protein